MASFQRWARTVTPTRCTFAMNSYNITDTTVISDAQEKQMILIYIDNYIDTMNLQKYIEIMYHTWIMLDLPTAPLPTIRT